MKSEATFGEKVDVFLGLIGKIDHQGEPITGMKMAEAMKCAPETFARFRKKTKLPSHDKLTSLISYWGLSDLVDFSIFQETDIDIFREKLKAAGVGGTSCGSLGMLSMRLHALHDAKAKSTINFSIVMRQTRGLSPLPDHNNIFVLQPGQYVRLQLKFRANHHVIILSEKINRYMAMLRPSELSENTLAYSSTAQVPDADADLEYQAFPVAADSGHFRLYAIWCDDDFIKMMKFDSFDKERARLNTGQIKTLIQALENGANNVYSVGIRDYRVS